MTGALLTAIFFGITPVCANRAIRLIGVLRANFYRLIVAMVVLGAWAFALGNGLSGPMRWFFVAGAVGFGLGGMAMFQALPRLGAPLACLIVESVAALSAAILAWLWLGDILTAMEIVFCLVVLFGVAVGLLPYIRGGKRRDGAVLGLLWAILAGIGQGVSITVTRKAILDMVAAGDTPHLPTVAFQRLLGGACVAFLVLLLLRHHKVGMRPVAATASAETATEIVRRPWFWVGLNAFFGPILGVTCLIWALKTMQPGLVQTVAATAPLVSVPFARWLEGHRPPALYYLGAVVAIAGLAGIHLYS